MASGVFLSIISKGGIMMKRLSIIFMIVFLLFSTAITAQAKIELTYWTHEDPNRTEIENRYINEFEKANPGVTVKRVTNPSKKMAELILTAFAANQGPDIFNLQIEDEYAYIVNSRLAPVDFKAAGYASVEAIYKAYIPKVLDPVTFEGSLFGLPLELTNWCLYVNDRVFKSAGLDPDKDYPKTWEEVVAVSEKIAIRKGEIIERRGFDFRYPYYLVSLVPMVEQLGGKLISDDGKKAIINDEAWIQFLEFMKEWGPNGKNLGSPTYTNARKLFNKDNNDIAMCMSGLYQAGRIRNDNAEFYDSGEWRVVPYPKFKNAVKDRPALIMVTTWSSMPRNLKRTRRWHGSSSVTCSATLRNTFPKSVLSNPRSSSWSPKHLKPCRIQACLKEIWKEAMSSITAKTVPKYRTTFGERWSPSCCQASHRKTH